MRRQHPRRGGAAADCAGDWLADQPRRRSLRTLQRTLRQITEALARELGQPGVQAPRWSEAEWAVARAVAAIHGVAPLLGATLRWRGPASWTRFLEAQTAHTAQRFTRIEQLLRFIDRRAREAAIPVVPLKGAALHALGIYAPGERPMADIDLLVHEGEAPGLAAILAAAGFSEAHRTWKHRVFAREADAAPAALGEHADNGIKIEVHCHVAEQLPQRAVDVTASVFPAAPQPGFNSYRSKAALLLHLLLHSAGALVMREGRLLQLHDISRLAALLSDADWQELLAEGRNGTERSLWWAFPPLALAHRYYGCVPERVLRHAARDSHWALRNVYRHRTLARSSLSYLWISAFPGIEWTRSLAAMAEYASARVLPSRGTRQDRRELARMQPQVSGGRWSQLSQRERIVRWILARQARHETLQPVRAALLGTPG